MSYRDRDDPRAGAEIDYLDGRRRPIRESLREFIAMTQDSFDQEFRFWARYQHIGSDGEFE